MTQPIIEKEFRGQKFYFYQTPMAQVLIDEIFSDNYKVFEKGIEFRNEDVVLDVGACEGMFSIMMARTFSSIRVISLEPVPRTYFQMVRNIGLNGCKNIEAYNIGIGKPGQPSTILYVGRNEYSGGSSAFLTFDPEKQIKVDVSLISLEEAFECYKVDRCRLLKIDIEGMEYNVLYCSDVLSRCDYMTAEFHTNQRLIYESRRMDALALWCSNQTQLIQAELCKMAE